MEEKKLKKTRRRAPTAKQIKALQLVNQGYSKRRAMLEAGYSKNVANQSSRLLKGTAIQGILETMKAYLSEEGLTAKYMAGKFKEWMEATKVITSHTEPDILIPDYDTQIKAYDRWEKVINKEEGDKVTGLRRKITFEEFVGGEEKINDTDI